MVGVTCCDDFNNAFEIHKKQKSAIGGHRMRPFHFDLRAIYWDRAAGKRRAWGLGVGGLGVLLRVYRLGSQRPRRIVISFIRLPVLYGLVWNLLRIIVLIQRSG